MAEPNPGGVWVRRVRPRVVGGRLRGVDRAGGVCGRAGVSGCCFIGYFEGLTSTRGIAWRVGDSPSLRSFLDLEVTEAAPDHSTLSRTRRRIDEETHPAVFALLERVADAGLVPGGRRSAWMRRHWKRTQGCGASSGRHYSTCPILTGPTKVSELDSQRRHRHRALQPPSAASSAHPGTTARPALSPRDASRQR